MPYNQFKHVIIQPAEITWSNITGGAANVNYTLLVVGSLPPKIVRLRSLFFRLVTDATVASRNPYIVWLDSGANEVHSTRFTGTPQGASVNMRWIWSLNTAPFNVTATNEKRCETMPDVIALSQFGIRLTINNGQAGDTISEINIHYEEWSEH